MKKCKECVSCECIKNAYLNSIKVIYSHLGAMIPKKDKKFLKSAENEILKIAGINIDDNEINISINNIKKSRNVNS